MEEVGVIEQERITLKEELAREASEAVLFDRTSPEYTAKMLALMDDLEKAREILGQFNATVGEGDDRAVVFTNFRDTERVSSMKLDIEPGTDYGPVRTTYRERLVVNRTGVYVLASVQDNRFDYDPSQRLPTSSAKREFDPERLKQWSQYKSVLAKHYGGESEELLSSVLASGKYPEITITPPVSGSHTGWTSEQDSELHRQIDANSIGDLISPTHVGLSPLTDTEFETRPLRGLYTGGFKKYRVTKPELVGSVIKAVPTGPPTPAPVQLAA